jgi:hypothetical protein
MGKYKVVTGQPKRPELIAKHMLTRLMITNTSKLFTDSGHACPIDMYSSTLSTRAVDLFIAARWCFRFPQADGLEKTGSLPLYLTFSPTPAPHIPVPAIGGARREAWTMSSEASVRLAVIVI